MAETIASLVTKVQDEVANSHSNATTLLTRYLIDALKELSDRDVRFNEGSGSFDTVVAQQAYDSSDTGFPKDVVEFYTLYYTDNTNFVYEMEKVPIGVIRQLNAASVTTGGGPSHYAWHNRQIVLAPPIDSIVTISFDYRRDATRDTSTGNEITESTTGLSNHWVIEGEGQAILRAKVLDKWYSLADNNAARAAQYRTAWMIALEEAENLWYTETGGFQAERSF